MTITELEKLKWAIAVIVVKNRKGANFAVNVVRLLRKNNQNMFMML